MRMYNPSQITLYFVPMVDINARDASGIYSTIKLSYAKAKIKIKHVSPIITFHLSPKHFKASEIVSGGPVDNNGHMVCSLAWFMLYPDEFLKIKL